MYIYFYFSFIERLDIRKNYFQYNSTIHVKHKLTNSTKVLENVNCIV